MNFGIDSLFWFVGSDLLEIVVCLMLFTLQVVLIVCILLWTKNSKFSLLRKHLLFLDYFLYSRDCDLGLLD